MSAATQPRRLVLVGSIVVDVKLRLPHLPERGGDVVADTLSIGAGGGMFVLQAAVRGGLLAVYAGRHGSGLFGDVVRSALRTAGVEPAFDPDQAGDTGPCMVLVEPDGERTMITATGVEAELGPDRLEQLEIREDDSVYVSGYDLTYPVTGPAVAAWVSNLPAGPVMIFDPGPLVAEIPGVVLDPVLARTDVLTLNDRELTLLTGSVDPVGGGSLLLARLAPDGVVVLRSGSRGAMVLERGAPSVEVPTRPIAAADTTGAGDTHTGALTAARSAGLAWVASVEAANAAVAAFLERVAH